MFLIILAIIALLTIGGVAVMKGNRTKRSTDFTDLNEVERIPTSEPRRSLAESDPIDQYQSDSPQLQPQIIDPQPIIPEKNQLLGEYQSDSPEPDPLIFYDSSSQDSRELILARLRTSLSKIYSMPPEYQNLAARYIKNMDQVYQETFVLDDRPQMKEITSFGIALLHKFADDNQPTDYLTIVGHLITRVCNELKKTRQLVHVPTTWNQKYYYFCVRLTRMLAMFEILGTDESIKTMCHRQICKITPKLDKSLEWTKEGIELAWIAIPRLITNFLYDTSTYEEETSLSMLKPIMRVLKVELAKKIDVVKDGIYVEKSSVFNGVATYWPLVESGEFYASVFRAFGFTVDIDVITTKILDKILHPSMDVVPLGLFGPQQISLTKTLATNWPNYQRNADYEVGIFPVIGLGVFKSDRFLFWVRVQRWYLAAYESDQTDFESAAGWIQMRKLWLKGVEHKYQGAMTWPKIKMQPGVISFEDDSENFEIFKPYREQQQHYSRDVISHVGTLMDEGRRVLYWKNQYKFAKLFGDTQITEFGVCTDNGLVMRLEVLNLTGKTLKVKVKDDDIDGMIFDCQSNADCTNGIVKIGDGSTVINWRQVFDRDVLPLEVTLDSTGKYMAFKFAKDNYVVESFDALHFVKKNSRVILAGSFEKSLSYIIKYDDYKTVTHFKFNPNTLMYTAISERN